MFGFFKKKSDVERLINADGIDHATDRFAEIVARKLSSREMARQFVLEEIEAASQGNEASKAFARKSGIELREYQGAMKNSNPLIDGPDGPQQLLVGLSMQLLSKPALMVQFRTMIVDKIMKKYEFGKYGE